MPIEITIRRRDAGNMGNSETVYQAIKAFIPTLEFQKELSGPEKIKAAAEAGYEFPEVIRKNFETMPAYYRAEYSGEDGSIDFLLGEGGDLSEVQAEIRGSTVPAAALHELGQAMDWVFIANIDETEIHWDAED